MVMLNSHRVRAVPADDEPELLTLPEAAAFLRQSPRTVRKWAKEGKIPVLNHPGKKLLFERAALLRALRQPPA